MLSFVRTDRFKRAYRKLEPAEQELVKKALRQLAEDRTHPGLRVKRIKGTDDIWEMRAGRDIRITFEIGDDAYTLRNVGHHDATLREPFLTLSWPRPAAPP
ncbi:type II toxin-antitoxin system RelE/ParE family toxin [Promineifilum sp.]|uniref:type II toxin-antitoxin system RelE family toxin n=1 Tax=Promineifilum sp. TaxID=2664178 RepID=UPI0035B0B9FC